ncbi:MAG TPA: glucose-6-phosphate dehydrogenase assembly protein OpcA [Candidatus Dormibacteraeota bacterium]|nr:glucose-6-phosphate dehydrogenase assembly protein OpcA [Candidatus Dormibacteraeota bacterium]
MTADPDLDWHGESVTIADVLAALNRSRRKFAHVEAEDEEHPHPRNCVMTLVAVVPDANEEKRAIKAVTEISQHHPCLAIVVRDQPQIRAGRINATVTAHPVLGAFDQPAPCELVTLHVHGAAGSHLAALVDPLLVSGVPTYMWWPSTPPFGTGELTDALRICDALVVDSARFDRPYHSFLELAELAERSHRKLGLADLQWERLLPWREAAAQFFAPAERRGFIQSIAEVGIDYMGDGRGNRIAAALMIGWFASALGWKLEHAAAGGGGVVAALFKAEGWRPVQVAFRSVQRGPLTQGEIMALRIAGTAAGKSFSLSVQRDPQRSRPPQGGEFQRLHPTGGEDDAAMEIAQRRASRHREVVSQNLEALHHTSTGEAPGESVPQQPTVMVRERRRTDTSDVMLTMIDLGGGEVLRHVQRVPPLDESTMLLNVLSAGARDVVYGRALAAAADLMQKL